MAIATAAMLTINYPITDRDELWLWVKSELGVAIPRERVCANHVAPFTAFADAYFGETEQGERVNVAVWKASRGLGGKSHLEATLGRTEAETLGASASILGGSKVQSDRVLQYITEFFDRGQAKAKGLITRDVTSETLLANGALLTSLTASTKSVRGAHPPRLRMDEIDEMAMRVLQPALGQPMRQPGINGSTVLPQTVLCSTHQYADGPMTWALSECDVREGWRAYEWCYRENLVGNGGWLTEEQVEETRATMTLADWNTEVENQEPSPGARAIDSDAIDRAFDPDRGTYTLVSGRECIIEPPDPHGDYTTGADWAKKQDETWIVTIRVDVHPRRIVAVRYGNRLPWPVMVKWLNDRLDAYDGYAAHDANGVGDVVGDYLTHSVEGCLWSGRSRSDGLSNYIGAIERGDLVGPRITPMYKRHRQASNDDVYRTGDKFHCPDEIMAGAIAWHAQGSRVTFGPRPRV